MLNTAVFLDRDGVLNVYLPEDYVKNPSELELLPGVGEAVAQFNAVGLPVFIISNQQGVAKGIMTEEDLTAIDCTLHERLNLVGATIERSYYCTAHASEDSEDRKPRPGMLLKAAREYNIDLGSSVFIGDTETDAQAARSAGVGSFILVLTGKHRDATVAQNQKRFPIPPDYVAQDLADAAEWFLGKQGVPSVG